MALGGCRAQTFKGAPRLVHAMSVSSVKSRRGPSRYCRDARIHGSTTTTGHDIEYTHPNSRGARVYGHTNIYITLCMRHDGYTLPIPLNRVYSYVFVLWFVLLLPIPPFTTKFRPKKTRVWFARLRELCFFVSNMFWQCVDLLSPRGIFGRCSLCLVE